MTQDVALAQAESDAGLLEVDIIELLFDCPPDGAPPSTGLGAPCASNGDCDAGQVCDLDNAGGRCAPDPATTNVGAPCTSTTDCGSYERNACNNEVGDGYPGGYCSLEPCDDVQVCPPGGTCVAVPFETPACMQSCAADSDCRVDEGYVCQLFPTTPPNGFGPSDHPCAFACSDDEECTPPLKCDVASGNPPREKRGPPPPVARRGGRRLRRLCGQGRVHRLPRLLHDRDRRRAPVLPGGTAHRPCPRDCRARRRPGAAVQRRRQHRHHRRARRQRLPRVVGDLAPTPAASCRCASSQRAPS